MDKAAPPRKELSGVYTHRFVASVKGGLPDRPLTNTDSGVPPAFLDLHERWRHRFRRGGGLKAVHAEICRAIETHLQAEFFVGNLVPDLPDLLVDDTLPAIALKVTHFEFSAGPVPWIRAKAVFDLPFAIAFSDRESFVDWETAHDEHLDHAVIFQYDFDVLGADEELVMCDFLSISLEGPVPLGAPETTYAERVTDTVKLALKSARDP